MLLNIGDFYVKTIVWDLKNHDFDHKNAEKWAISMLQTKD